MPSASGFRITVLAREDIPAVTRQPASRHGRREECSPRAHVEKLSVLAGSRDLSSDLKSAGNACGKITYGHLGLLGSAMLAWRSAEVLQDPRHVNKNEHDERKADDEDYECGR